MRTSKVLNWIVALAGLWELLSPFILGYSAMTVAMWNAIIFGVILIITGLWAALTTEMGAEKILNWFNALVGLWLVVSPFILTFSAAMVPLWNGIIVGVVVIILALVAVLAFTGSTTSPQA